MNRGQSFLLLLIGVVSVIAVFIVVPFFEYVIAAVILAYVLFPVHVRLEEYVGGLASAIALIAGSLVAVIVPLAYIVWVLLGDLRDIAGGESTIDTARIEATLSELLGGEVDFDLAEALSLAGQQLVEILFGGFTGVVTFTLQASLGLALMLFLVYYVLQEGEEFVAWVRDLIPLPPAVTEDLVVKIDATTRGVVFGHIIVAVLQAILAGAGLWLVGIPNVVFWTFVMAVLALLPLIGAFLVWGPAAAYLYVVDEVTAAVFLLVYSVTVVSLFDNYARPILIDQQASLNPAVILVGVLGGVYSIGFTGLFVGPVVIGVLAATLETFREDYDRI